MKYFMLCWRQIRSLALSLFKRSFKAHESVFVSNVSRSLAFYQKLGFRRVTSTRADEVVLVRNHRGDEVNIVERPITGAIKKATSRVSLEVGDLEQELSQLRHWYPHCEIIEDSVTKRVELTDPDGNTIELNAMLEPKQRAKSNIYHIATHSELIAGISEHYYLPPDSENRFVRARARSAILSLACNRIAQEVDSAPLIIEMDVHQLRVEEQLFEESDFDSLHSKDYSTYPRVNSPIARNAIVAVGACEEVGGEFPWPKKFQPLGAIIGE